VENTLKARLNTDLRQALRSGDSLRCSVLRLLISAIGYAEMARQTQLNDDDIYAVIAKEIKQRKESIAAFNQGKRPELAAKEEAEMAILAGYMPQQMSVAEIEDLVRRVKSSAGIATNWPWLMKCKAFNKPRSPVLLSDCKH